MDSRELSDTKNASQEASTAAPQGARSLRKKTVFALVMLAGLLGFVEAAFAAYYFLAVPRDQRYLVEATLGLRSSERNTVLRYRPHPYLNYVGNPDYVYPDGLRPYHEIGIRATDVPLTERRPGVLRIVAMGGSTTYGHAFREAKNVWPEIAGERLASSLGVEIDTINIGVINYTTFELLGLAMMWLPEFQADIVVVHTGLNDAFSVGFPDEGGLDNTSFRHSWAYTPVPGLARISMRLSYLIRVSGMRWLSEKGYMIGDMTPSMQYAVPALNQVRENVRGATGKYFRRNLETLIVLIRRAGATPVLANMPLNPAMERGLGPYYDAVSQAVIRNNRIMAEVGEQEGVVVADLFSRMRDSSVFLDAGHVNSRGMERKAQIIAEALEPIVSRELQ
ncbi:MAG: SGNH/GDSL hydrolase family protein [Acidobacteria bacterium]|nr:SGNH/GDSL hydrolase family protein [Acidobacteriota bacterium]